MTLNRSQFRLVWKMLLMVILLGVCPFYHSADQLYKFVNNEKHPEFKQTGLKLTSTIKLDKVATISKELIIGEIGEIGAVLKKEINRKITEIYGF
jgi:hypothetical protein